MLNQHYVSQHHAMVENTCFIHSFIHFSNYFILVRVVVDPEPRPGILEVRQEYNLDRMPVYCMHTIRKHIHT